MGSRYTVRTVSMEAREVVPALIDRRTGLPPILPTRWIMRRRRQEVAVNTMKNDLYGIGELYEWAQGGLSGIEESPYEFFGSGGALSPRQLDALVDHVREKRYESKGVFYRRSHATTAARLGSIELFLGWASDPYDRGSRPYVPPGETEQYRRRLAKTMEPFKKSAESKRPDPLTPEQDAFLRGLIGPVRDEEGYPLTPLRFSEKNPFYRSTRLRNWLVYLLLRELRLRRGEALKVTTNDLPRSHSGSIEIIRRPHDGRDTRSPRPQVKGVEGVCPANPLIMLGVGTYLTGMRHTGRRTKGTHYLFTTRNGTPLSVRGCNAIFETIKENYPDRFDQLSPHVLRHTWAEEAAHDLIGNGSDEESAINMLRKAGRWKKGSEQPMHYAQKAIEAKANERLRDLHRTFYDT